MTARLVKNIDEFKKTLNWGGFSFDSFSLNDEEIRKNFNSIFNDISFIDQNDNQMVEDYLCSIKDNIDYIQSRPLCILYILDKMHASGIELRIGRYFLFPEHGFISEASLSSNTIIHRVSRLCEKGENLLLQNLQNETPFRCWTCREEAEMYFDGEGNFCLDCELCCE